MGTEINSEDWALGLHISQDWCMGRVWTAGDGKGRQCWGERYEDKCEK